MVHRKPQSHALTLLLLLSLLLAAGSSVAEVTGKISGIVVDAVTGKPVVGASVRILALELATQTDEDGEYFIISVPVGSYDLTTTHVGFETLTQKQVRVLADLTTPADFAIEITTIELADEMVVYATAPLIQRDLTASRIIFTEERLRNLPNINTVQSILTNYPGVVIGKENDLHVRGGRAGQLSYYYDGFSVQDPFTATAGMRILPTALAELSLTSGGFTAEYGDALSGVVNAVTREGTSDYRGRLRLFQGGTHRYDISTGKWGGLQSVLNRSGSFNLSGPLPVFGAKRNTFFAAGEYLRDDGYLPHNWSTSYTGTAKVSVQPTSKLKLKTNVTYYQADGAVYEHRDVNGVSYDFNLDGLPIWDKKAYLTGLSGKYAVNERMIASLTLNRFFTQTTESPAHLEGIHWRDWPGYTEDANGVYNGTIDDDNYANNRDWSDPQQAIGFTAGDNFNPSYRFRQTVYNSILGNIVAQPNKTNQIKAGFEYRRYRVEWDFKQFYNDFPYGEQYVSRPLQTSAYVEDKLEYHDIVVNMGMRFDFRDADISYNATPDDTVAVYKEAESKSRFSPRLGMSFPMSEKTAIHFNYGIYYQVPQYVYLYTNLDGDRSSGLPILGNPDLNPEETVAYELGVDHLIGSSLRLDVTAYYKDIEQLVTTREIGNLVAGSRVARYVNDDYGNVSGFDVSLEQLPLNGYFSGSISYGYMMAQGNGSDANEPYYTYLNSSTDTLPPVNEFPLDFDQRHTITAVLDYRVPADWSANLLGLNIPGAWGLSMVGYFGSGLPYSKVDASGYRMGKRNENRLPATYAVDARLNKDFLLGNAGNMLTLFVEVDNLFNRRNVLNVYARTGKPDDDLFVSGAGLSLNEEDLTEYDRLYDHDPQNFSPPRTVRTGLEYSF